jgi:hypothetical protein
MRLLTLATPVPVPQGEWLEDNFVGDFGSCDAAEALATAMDAEHVAEHARDFMYKPDGGASSLGPGLPGKALLCR